MKFGTFLSSSVAQLGIGAFQQFARTAEDCGYDSLWVADHPALPSVIPHRYPYSRDGSGVPHFTSKSLWFDPLLTLSYLAAITSRIRLGTHVYLLPLRKPILTARGVANLDQLCQGRFDFGIGVGWLEEEFSNLDENFVARGRRADEIVKVLKGLWSQDDFRFDGEFYRFESVSVMPKPVQHPHPPLLVGGQTPPALRRAAHLGDGWLGMEFAPGDYRVVVERIAELRQSSGRGHLPFSCQVTFGVTSGLPATLDLMRRYEEAGADQVNLHPWSQPDGPLTLEHCMVGLERFAIDVIGKM